MNETKRIQQFCEWYGRNPLLYEKDDKITAFWSFGTLVKDKGKPYIPMILVVEASKKEVKVTPFFGVTIDEFPVVVSKFIKTEFGITYEKGEPKSLTMGEENGSRSTK
jgi:hypothetical protein